ncbi:MAG: hypothetical protein IJ809_01145 [Clostridia bacterium]|nr:hypothetical protein [Clostridia bacterium]
MNRKQLEKEYNKMSKSYEKCKEELEEYKKSRAFVYINKMPDKFKKWLLEETKKKEKDSKAQIENETFSENIRSSVDYTNKRRK